jgi:spermidine synthase
MMAQLLAPASKGVAKIEHCEISQHDSDFSRLRAAIGHTGEFVEAGTYAQLRVNGSLMMSDTRNERQTNRDVVCEARGDVLIAGLGLGMIIHPIAAKETVTSVTVLEKYQDVIDLVAPSISSPKVKIVCADVFDWRAPRGSKWNVIYFDIWPDISTDNLPEMAKLHRRYRSRLRAGGWMDSWMREDLRLYR